MPAGRADGYLWPTCSAGQPLLMSSLTFVIYELQMIVGQNTSLSNYGAIAVKDAQTTIIQGIRF
jgi:hypothetical protein